jgi:hypothetical protein
MIDAREFQAKHKEAAQILVANVYDELLACEECRFTDAEIPSDVLTKMRDLKQAIEAAKMSQPEPTPNGK